MSGSSQAVNLGGMLSQIGNTLGTKVDATGLMGNIQRMSQPELDPTSPESLMKQAQWANSVGNREEAALYGQRAADMTEKQQAAAAASREQGYVKSASGLTAAYENALLSGNQEEANKIRQAMVGLAGQSGINTAEMLGSVDKRLQDANPATKGFDIKDGYLINKDTGEVTAVGDGAGQPVDWSAAQIEAFRPVLPPEILAQVVSGDISREDISDYIEKPGQTIPPLVLMDARAGIAAIDEILEADVNGYEAAILSWLPGSAAMDQADLVETIRSKLSFDVLAGLKKQGVSLGPITEKEWPKIEALISTLNPKNPERMRKNLAQIRTRMMFMTDADQGYIEGYNQLSDERPVGYINEGEVLVDASGTTPFMYKKNSMGEWTLVQKTK